MIDELLPFVYLTPIWATGLLLLAVGSRWRGLARPLPGGARVRGIVVAHEPWLLADGRETDGIVVDFAAADGRLGRLIEPPVRGDPCPPVGAEVTISHRTDDLTFAKRCSRRQQVIGWLATIASVPILVGVLRVHPLPMTVVIALHIGWLAWRRWRPPPGPARHQAGSSSLGVERFDPTNITVPTSPPQLDDSAGTWADGRPASSLEPLPDALHRHFYVVVSTVAIVAVALVGASRSADEFAFGWHLLTTALLLAGVVLFETSLPLRGGRVVPGVVVDHLPQRTGEGDVHWLEVVEFPIEGGPAWFVDTFGPRRQRSVGAPVTVSYRVGEPERARALQRSQSVLGTALIAVAVGVGTFVSAPTWAPVLIQTAVCYVGFIALDLVRGGASRSMRPSPV